MSEKLLVEKLLRMGTKILNRPYKRIEFTGVKEADTLLNDITDYPHAFVLACVMDRQIKAEKAWIIPYRISLLINGFEFEKLKKLSKEDVRVIFKKNSLHRFIEQMADNFYLAILDIDRCYKGKASNIWADSPRSATIVRRFLQFNGVGIKIATMATNILARDYKVPMADKYCIDISPDVQVKRVFTRLGLIPRDASNDELIYCARELHPEYPGIFDLSAWEIGRNWCRPKQPKCTDCYLSEYCRKADIE